VVEVVGELPEALPDVVVAPGGGVTPPVVVVVCPVVVAVELTLTQGLAVKEQVLHSESAHQLGRGVQKLLHCTVTLKEGGLDKNAGTDPFNELCERSSVIKPGRDPRKLGIEPVRSLKLMFKNWRSVSVLRLSGMVPDSELALISKTVRDSKPPRPGVMVPDMPVLERPIVCSEGDTVLRLFGMIGWSSGLLLSCRLRSKGKVVLIITVNWLLSR